MPQFNEMRDETKVSIVNDLIKKIKLTLPSAGLQLRTLDNIEKIAPFLSRLEIIDRLESLKNNVSKPDQNLLLILLIQEAIRHLSRDKSFFENSNAKGLAALSVVLQETTGYTSREKLMSGLVDETAAMLKGDLHKLPEQFNEPYQKHIEDSIRLIIHHSKNEPEGLEKCRIILSDALQSLHIRKDHAQYEELMNFVNKLMNQVNIQIDDQEYTIDFNQPLTDNDKEMLKKIIEQSKKRNPDDIEDVKIRKNEIFFVQTPHGISKCSLSHSVLPEQGKKNTKYEVVGLRLGMGGAGTVKFILKTLKISGDKLIEKERNEDNAKVVKAVSIQSDSLGLKTREQVVRVTEEEANLNSKFIEGNKNVTHRERKESKKSTSYHKSYLFMPYIKGQPISKFTPDGKSPQQLFDLINNLVQAVAKMHATGWAHLDLNAKNILFDSKTDEVYLIDFGTARRLAQKSRLGGVSPSIFPIDLLSAFNKQIEVMIDDKIDVYSVGCIISILLQKIEKLESPTFSPELDMGLRSLVNKMVLRSSDDRPSMDEVISTLNHLKKAFLEEESKIDVTPPMK
ncbi:AarF/UbiB family protein [Legionella sp. PATHC038]|uniref:protein kinase domain-containing protein n=1 Tax=Legionella sheltonii TaxID=2992041 RepID=UPI00224485D6|nr:lipopolysaccharide kinase InaA family protein [Legionella sp. PATHC038]MCW8397244.1 AarF/UbiB family protein [Legionella sp. PATHC038]